jgi:DMSO/TMAO reductase YedYZ molybdopterin-dependent catalytic subunit
MAKNTRIIITTVAVLTIIVAVFAFLNRESVLEKKLAQESGFFVVCAGEDEYTVAMEDILSLSPFAISANYKTTGRAAETRVYQGVSFKALMESMEIDYGDYTAAIFSAADGYVSALRMAEAMDEGNCYIVIGLGGEPLGTRESGGEGPVMMILANDRFSQRWCKYLLEVRLK